MARKKSTKSAGMVIVSAADLHLDSTMVGGWDQKEGIHSNWVEAFKQLAALVDLCNERKADLLAISGDVFHNGRPTSEAVYRMNAEFKRLETAKIVITNGNHDQSSVVSNHRTPVDAYIGSLPQTFHAAGESEVVEFNGVDIALIPWHRVAGTKSLDSTSSVLRDNISRLAEEIADNDRPSFLMGHFTVDEAVMNNGTVLRSSETMMSGGALEATVPIEHIDSGPWTFWRAGHVHRRQKLGKKGYYAGSTYRVSFGEIEEEKGAEVITLFDDSTYEAEFVPFDARKLHILDISEDLIIPDEVDDMLQERDIFRVMFPFDAVLPASTNRIIKSLRQRGIEVEPRRLPRAVTTPEGGKRMSLETSPKDALQSFYDNRYSGPHDKKSFRKPVLAAFDNVMNGSTH